MSKSQVLNWNHTDCGELDARNFTQYLLRKLLQASLSRRRVSNAAKLLAFRPLDMDDQRFPPLDDGPDSIWTNL